VALSAIARPQAIQAAQVVGETGFLRLYLGYRVVLGVALLLVFAGLGQGLLGSYRPELFLLAVHAYIAVAVVSLVLFLRRVGDDEIHGQAAVFADIVLLSVMMHASAGIQSGLGMLIAVSIALGSLSLVGRTALLFAALASLAVLAEQVYSHTGAAADGTAYAQAGMLGAAYFALALLAHRLGKRAAESEELADRRASDLVQLGELNDHVIQQMRAGIVVIDAEQTVQVMNEAAWALLGMPLAMRHHQLRDVSQALQQQYQAWLDDPYDERADFRATAAGRDLRARFAPIGGRSASATLIVLEDIARLNAEAQQLKLASLGRLTAGIAHEIRNPLGAISHAAQLLGESPDLAGTDRRMAEIIQQNSSRVNAVVESILRLSRQHVPRLQPLVLGPWLADRVDDIRQAHGLAAAQVRASIEPPDTTVPVDPGQLRQVIDVLCDNAIRHFEAPIEQLRIRLVGGVTPESAGPFIEIRDNGPGIPADARRNLFEPFFTTRHDGTGLGLYIAQQLCEANHVRIEYLSPPTGGSCFRLSFASRQRQRPL
jgi:two-component system, NtrC family, sensor histidine kinase PilS